MRRCRSPASSPSSPSSLRPQPPPKLCGQREKLRTWITRDSGKVPGRSVLKQAARRLSLSCLLRVSPTARTSWNKIVLVLCWASCWFAPASMCNVQYLCPRGRYLAWFTACHPLFHEVSIVWGYYLYLPSISTCIYAFIDWCCDTSTVVVLSVKWRPNINAESPCCCPVAVCAAPLSLPPPVLHSWAFPPSDCAGETTLSMSPNYPPSPTAQYAQCLQNIAFSPIFISFVVMPLFHLCFDWSGLKKSQEPPPLCLCNGNYNNFYWLR